VSRNVKKNVGAEDIFVGFDGQNDLIDFQVRAIVNSRALVLILFSLEFGCSRVLRRFLYTFIFFPQKMYVYCGI